MLHSGETAAYFGVLGSTLGGIYYGWTGHRRRMRGHAGPLLRLPAARRRLLPVLPRGVTRGRRRESVSSPVRAASGCTALFFGRAGAAANRSTSRAPSCPPARVASRAVPVVRQRGGRRLRRSGGRRVRPGGGHLGTSAASTSTTPTCAWPDVDLRAVPAAQTATLRAQLSFDTEPGYDNVIVEAHTVGQDNWTTLVETGGLTSPGGSGGVRRRLPARGATRSCCTTSPR